MGEDVVQKAPFGNPGIEDGTKIQPSSKNRHREPLKTIPWRGFENHENSINLQSDNLLFLEPKNMPKVLVYIEI